MPTSAAELVALIARIAEGDRAAFEPLFRATSAKLYGIVLRILRRREVADEVIQDVYVRIWQRAGDFDPMRASPITWMAVIARNRAIDEARRAGVPTVSDEAAVMAVPDPGRSAVETIAHGEDLRRLAGCIDEIDAPRGNLVRMAYLDGLSRQELAARLGQPVGTIKTWLHRSLKQIRDCLER